jgi:hypothetical protein
MTLQIGMMPYLDCRVPPHIIGKAFFYRHKVYSAFVTALRLRRMYIPRRRCSRLRLCSCRGICANPGITRHGICALGTPCLTNSNAVVIGADRGRPRRPANGKRSRAKSLLASIASARSVSSSANSVFSCSEHLRICCRSSRLRRQARALSSSPCAGRLAWPECPGAICAEV